MSRKKSRIPGAVVLVAAALLAASLVGASIPAKMNYQGRLTDSGTGLPLPGSHSAVFKIYDDSTDGSLLWTESTSVTADTNGVFSVILGSVNPIDISFDGPAYLQVEIDGETLTPRREMVSSPYAFNALNAEELGGLPASDYPTGDLLGGAGTINDPSNPVDWTQLKNVPAGFADGADDVGGSGDGHSLDAADGNPIDVVYVDNAGYVGIGTPDPDEKLHVVGDIRLEANGDIAFGDDNTRVYDSGDDLYLTADDDLTLTPDDDVYIRKDGSASWARFDSDQQWLGVGTVSPAYNLHVHEPSGAANYLLITNNTTGATSNDGLQVGMNGAGAAFIYCQENQYFRIGNNDQPQITISTGGDVGIGTQSPTSQLTVENTSWAEILKVKDDGTDDGLFLSSGYTWASISAGDFNRDDIVILHSTGKIGIGGVTNPVYDFEVDGLTYIEGNSSGPSTSCKNTNHGGTGLLGTGNDTQGYYLSGGTGVSATGHYTGLYARANQTGNNAQEAIYCYLPEGTQDVRVCYRSTLGTQYKIQGDGATSTIMPTSKGQVALVCPESPEAWFEDFGSGEVVKGKCHIELEPIFLECISVNEKHPLKVFVQLTSPAEQQYYVNKGTTGFDVIFVGDGADEVNATFDYKIVAKWKGLENYRFEAVDAFRDAQAMAPVEHTHGRNEAPEAQ